MRLSCCSGCTGHRRSALDLGFCCASSNLTLERRKPRQHRRRRRRIPVCSQGMNNLIFWRQFFATMRFLIVVALLAYVLYLSYGNN